MTTVALQTRRSQLPGHRHNCPCPPCRELKNAWSRARHRQIGYGTWQPWTDIEPTRAHLRDLMAAGATLRRIAEAGGYDHGYLGRVLWGPLRQISPEIADKILAITLNQTGIADNTHVDPTGTLRRLRALHATGRPIARIARDIDRSLTTVQKAIREQRPITATFAAHVAAHYPALAQRNPEADGVPSRNAREARDRAASLGWDPPSAWDADIDDPKAIANTDSTRQRQDTAESRAFREAQMEDARLLTVRGYTAEAIGAHLGVAERTVIRWRVANGWKKADP